MGEVQHIFLVGAKSLGAYGGYETFVDKITEYHQNSPEIKYHVASKANGDGCMRFVIITTGLMENCCCRSLLRQYAIIRVLNLIIFCVGPMNLGRAPGMDMKPTC